MKTFLLLLALVGGATFAPIEDSNNHHALDAATPFNPWFSMQNDILTMLKSFTLANASNVSKGYNNYLQAGVIFYGSEAKVGLPLGSSYDDFVNLDFASFYFKNDSGVTDLGVGLNAAYDVLYTNNKRNGPKVVIVMTNTYDDVDVTVDPMVAASKLKSKNATIMTYQYPEVLITDGIHNEVLYNIVSRPAFYFNSTSNTMEDLENAQCIVNCYCPSFATPFLPDSDTGAPNQGCFYGSFSQMDFSSAEAVCSRFNNGIIAKIQNAFLETFTQSLIRSPSDYWIGLSYNSSMGGWMWQDNTKLDSYNNFPGSKVPSGQDGDCVMASYAKSWIWQTTTCDQKTEKQFVCEIQPCDSINYCT